MEFLTTPQLPSIAWPALDLSPRLDLLAVLWRGEPTRPSPNATVSEVNAYEAAMAAWRRAVHEKQQECCSLFAKANGWIDGVFHLTKTPEGIRQDIFVDAAGGLVAQVLHVWLPIDLSRLPEGVAVDRLPRSWFITDQTLAYIIRPLTDDTGIDSTLSFDAARLN